MVRTRSMTAGPPNLSLIKTKVAQLERKVAQLKRKAEQLERTVAQLKRKAGTSSTEELKRMALKRMAASAFDVDKTLRLKRKALEAIETKCFPLAEEARLAAAAEAQASGADKEKIPEKKTKKKKKVVMYLVSQRYIDHLMEAGLFHYVDEIPEDKLAKESQLFRDTYRSKMLLTEKLRPCEQFILDQYDPFGYAYDAKEVTDDEGEAVGEGVVVVNN